jgi:hypothetical protein
MRRIGLRILGIVLMTAHGASARGGRAVQLLDFTRAIFL